jgi:hypothetical protein
MPRIVDYPRDSIARSLKLSTVVDDLGGEATEASAADHLGVKVTGAFRALIGAAVKYGLVSISRGRIKTEPGFQNYKLAYNDTEKLGAIRKAFLTPPLFASLAQRLEGKEIPAHLERLLIREHDVPENQAERVASFFREGAKDAGLIGTSGIIVNTNVTITPGAGALRTEGSAPSIRVGNAAITEEPDVLEAVMTADAATVSSSGYNVRITGPGMDSRISIKEEEDIDIVEVMLKKVRRLIKEKDEEAKGG